MTDVANLEETQAKLPFSLPDMEGFDAVWLDDKQGYKITIPNGALLYIPNFLSDKEIERAMLYLLHTSNPQALVATDIKGFHEQSLNDHVYSNIPWKQEYVQFFSNKQALPRLTSWHGDGDKSYTYSGIVNTPAPWNPCLLYIKHKIESLVDRLFNSVLLNWYRDSSDSIGWHSDDERELGVNPVIASVSIGEERPFLIRNKYDHAIKFDVKLASGSLLVMAGALQEHWQHSIPKQSKSMGSRINMTFRNIYNQQY